MHIEKVRLRNFRCFGDEPCEITFESDITALVGENGAGKTALLNALKKLFSPIASDRRIARDDFHFGPGERIEDVDRREMEIEVVLAFPELDDDEDTPAHLAAIEDYTYLMKPGGSPRARLRLEALWEPKTTFEDEVEATVSWITSSEDIGFGEDSVDRRAVTRRVHDLIQMRYIPATRDGGTVTRVALKQLLQRIERSADWDDDTRKESSRAAEALQERLRGTPAFSWFSEALGHIWQQLHAGRYLRDPNISVVAREFEKLVRELQLVFETAPGGRSRSLSELSEGLVSLLYFALSATLYRLEIGLASPEKGDRPKGFNALEIVPPVLAIFAVEEPENHLSPFYLPRLIALLKKLAADNRAMAIVTSHSAAILRRVEPKQVRHLRLSTDATSRVKTIRLPENDEDAAKFIRQAVLAHPELYFAKLVILGEGDTEELVIPRIADALGVPLDPSFVAFVPLGGRHANHMWRLLDDLEIPHLTLLDLDAGRNGGGPGRIKNALEWLNDNANEDVRRLIDTHPPEEIRWNEEGAKDKIEVWCRCLESLGIYYSSPLDLDMAMLRAFPEAYGVGDDPELAVKEKAALLKSVYGKDHDADATAKAGFGCSDAELRAYRRLFKSRSKPASHWAALAKLTDRELQEGAPDVLKRLIEAAKEHLKPEEAAQ